MNTNQQRVLALDWGEKRIGVAFSEGFLASPHSVIIRKSRKEDYARIARLASELEVATIVLGLPQSLNPDAAIGPQAKRILKHQRELAEYTDRPIELVDEAYSTVDAAEMLRQTGRRKKTPIDAAAAAVILQTYLDREG